MVKVIRSGDALVRLELFLTWRMRLAVMLQVPFNYGIRTSRVIGEGRTHLDIGSALRQWL